MRLGILAPEFPPAAGGMQEHARNLVLCLAANHDVCVFTTKKVDEGCMPPNVRVEVEMGWQSDADRVRLARESVDAWLLLNAGISPYAQWLQNPAFVYVHGNDFMRPWYPTVTPPVRLARYAMRYAWHEAAVKRWRQARIRTGLQAARIVFANSKFSRALCMREFGLAADRVAVVAPGIGEEYFQDVARARRPELRIVTIARLEVAARRKNVDGVLEAIARLGGVIDIAYTVVGDGDDRARLQARASALGIASRVRFTGRLETDALRRLLADSDAFVMPVMPTKGDVEGFGMVYLEAAASGLPSIGTATGGIADAVLHGVTGLLLEDASVAGIVEGLRRFQRERDRFDPSAIRAFARSLSAPVCTAAIVAQIARSLG